MKIRHKQSGVELEGRFCECSNGSTGIPPRHYFSSVETSSLYDKREWEAVQPEPKWVDVSGECELLSGERVYHGASCVSDLQFGYRLRKVNLYAGYCSTEQQAAFIIEQRQA